MTAIVGVHGIWNHQPDCTPVQAAARLSERWTGALGSEVEVAYYASLLRIEAPQGGEELPPAGREVLMEWARALGMPMEPAQGWATFPVRYAVDWIARRHGLSHRMVGRFLRRACLEVTAYLDDPERRLAARDEVRRKLAEHAPRILIAHSLGSVVAYEALWADQSVPVELFLTLGSPLGMPDVFFDRLEPGVSRRPPNVGRWVNIADPGDLVAIPMRLGGRFAGIDADVTTPIGVFDFHRVTRYLAAEATVTAVAG